MLEAAVPLPVVALVLTLMTVSPSPDRVVRDPRVGESSGLAVSLRHRGVLWTHNDSGTDGVLFALAADGRTAARVRLKGVATYDWEAMAAYRDAAGRPMLAVADIGDNRAERPSVRIVTLPEPDLRNGTVTPSRVLRLTYPHGAVDAETLLVAPDGKRAYLVTKGFGSTIYEVPQAVWTSATATTATLVTVATVPLLLVTDGVMGPGGHPLLRTYSTLAVLPPLTGAVAGGALGPLAETGLPDQKQGESLTLRDASTALVGSEGTGQAILRVPLPEEMLAALRPEPARGAAAGGPAPGDPAPGGPGSSPGSGGGLWGGVSRWVPVGGAVLLAGSVLTLILRRGRRGGPRRSGPSTRR
ncbi:MAG: hypothetical protein QG622_1112 [Actinomycetota bacterium]|nr:hypothetical protein [Actinomycetota bacterium]